MCENGPMNRRSFLGNAFRRGFAAIGFWCYGLPGFGADDPELAPPQRIFLDALLDTLIPQDDYPGAIAAGVPMQLMRTLSGAARDRRVYRRGLDILSSRMSEKDARPFHQLSLARRSELLSSFESGFSAETLFFGQLRRDAMTAFYSSQAAYVMLGYQPPVGGYAYSPVEPGSG